MTLMTKFFTTFKIMAFTSFFFAAFFEANAFEDYARFEKKMTMSKIRTELWFDGLVKEQKASSKKVKAVSISEIKIALEQIQGPSSI